MNQFGTADRKESMDMIATKRKLIEQVNLLATTNDATTTLTACAALLDAAGTLMSNLTGEVVRVRMTAEGQPDVLDMVKYPTSASAPH